MAFFIQQHCSSLTPPLASGAIHSLAHHDPSGHFDLQQCQPETVRDASDSNDNPLRHNIPNPYGTPPPKTSPTSTAPRPQVYKTPTSDTAPAWCSPQETVRTTCSQKTITHVFFPPNTWPCLLATANYLQGTCNRLVGNCEVQTTDTRKRWKNWELRWSISHNFPLQSALDCKDRTARGMCTSYL